MKTRRSPALAVRLHCLLWLPCLISSACGARQAAAGGAQSQDNAQTALSSNLGDGSVPTAGPATTTLSLGDGGDLQGTKLAEVQPRASAPVAAVPASKAPHGNDPGRGISDIRAIILAHRDAARACYDKALGEHPGVEGNLVMQWTIDPKGHVTQASPDASRSQITEPSIVECVGSIIKNIQFVASQSGFESKASYPFNFHPRGARQPNAE